MLQNAYLVAKIHFDTDENEPRKEWWVGSAEKHARSQPSGSSATTHHSFLGSFSSVSKRNFASKYAFFSIFQNLQNFLAEFSKSCKILQKISDFWQKSGNFLKFRKMLRNFAKSCKFLKIQLENFVDFEKCWKMRIWMQNFVSIQPRTSPLKSVSFVSAEEHTPSRPARPGWSRPGSLPKSVKCSQTLARSDFCK